ncbi:MAG: hypothetical protein K6L76_09860 [Agarilytica sp.]
MNVVPMKKVPTKPLPLPVVRELSYYELFVYLVMNEPAKLSRLLNT